MAQPPRYTRVKNFADDFGHETDHSALNAELDKASNSINDIRSNLAILQADDGRLRPDVITKDSLSDDLIQGISADVRADVQGELDRAEAAALRAEKAADSIDIPAVKVLAEQIHADSDFAINAAKSAGESKANAEIHALRAGEAAAAAAESAVAAGSFKSYATGTADAMMVRFDQFSSEPEEPLTIYVTAPAGQYNETATPTLKVNDFDALPVRKGDGLDLAVRDIAGQVCQFHYRKSGPHWELQNPAWGINVPDPVPTGLYAGKMEYTGYAPNELTEHMPGWYFMNGDTFLRTSVQGEVLEGLPGTFRTRWGIVISGDTISLPSAFHPDGRGYYQRAGNGVTKAIGAIEGDAIRNIVGEFRARGISSDNYYSYSGALYGFNIGGTYSGHSSGSVNTGFAVDASRVVPTASENRVLTQYHTPVIYLGV